ncbi:MULTISPECIES: hypothetical protein [unclassified Crossiella]|uniref:hypothetical protein n=1 Tax=unclassified Crossiella TaxID=2620835 RepID=UPI001FFF05FA|nr:MULTISPECIES: hypothetical protein [unclassified Crossiella]MCK2240900.1 hypothetical protein [Crossiella sp. S99.2]MCK2253956.1 hypothetical protein [Crossiella sp. S99.1]
MTIPPPNEIGLFKPSAWPPAWRFVLSNVELTENQAADLIEELACRFGFGLALWTRRHLQAMLVPATDPHPRAVTDAEWHRVTETLAWAELGSLAEDPDVCGADLLLAIRQAGLLCYSCGLALPADSAIAETWGLCLACRAATTSEDILRAGCVSDRAGIHEHDDGHCVRCGVPMPDPTTR